MNQTDAEHTRDQKSEPLVHPRIAVTGFRGFIGRRLVETLVNLGAELTLLEGDVRQSATWGREFDVLIHLAAATGAEFSANPGKSFSVNLGGVTNALEACRNRSAAMVFPSTCGVYRPVEKGIVAESHPVEGRTPYAASKLMGEMLCESYASAYGVPCCVLRLFNVYGGGQGDPFLIPYLLRCAVEDAPAIVKHPDSVRDFVHVEDVVDAILKASSITSGHRVLNIGSAEPHSVSQVIDLVGQVIGRDVKWTSETALPDPHPSIWADIQNARECLGWAPKVSLERGLAETAQHLTNVGTAPPSGVQDALISG